MYGLESDTDALRLSLPFPLLFACPSHSLYCCTLPYSFPSLPFCPPLLFLLNPFPTLIPFMWGSGGVTPGKIFNTANARRCVLVHGLALKPVLYTRVLCQCRCIFVNRRLLASCNIAPPFTYSESNHPMTNVKRWFMNKMVSFTPIA